MQFGKISRRTALGLLAGAVAAPSLARASSDYPSKTISFVCAFPPGGSADAQVRYFANAVAEVSGHTVIVENKPGAAANIAAQYTARSAPDGHTILIHAGSSIAANMWLFKNPPVDVAKDLSTIATVSKQSFLISVRADSPYQTLADLVADQKKKGDAGSYGFIATAGKVLAEQLKLDAGFNTVGVQYKSTGDAVNDLLGGLIDFGVFDAGMTMAQVREGRFRALGIASGEPMAGAPGVPTLKEQGYNIDQLVWWGAMAPAGVPDEIVAKLSGWFDKVLADEKTVEFLRGQGADPFVNSPAEAQALMEKTIGEWKGYVEMAKLEVQ